MSKFAINMHIPLVDLKAQHDSMKSEIDSAIERVINNSSFIMGEEVKNFENKFADFCGAKHCIGASNGSTAIFATLKVLGIKPGDEVIVPVNTFAATAFAVTLCHAKPVFVDVNETDFLINIDLIEKNITPRTKAIIPVHFYGAVCDMDKIKEIADKHKIHIVEDCAQSTGSKYKGKTVPVCGIGTFSFFPAKILGSMGDAGAIVSDDDKFAETARKFVNQGRKDKYFHDIEGFNFRLSSLQAAILSEKLKHLHNWINKRKEIAEDYSKRLNNISGKQINQVNSDSAYYMYVIIHSKRDKLKDYLKENGVETGVHYPIALHLQPAFAYLGYKKGDFPVAESISEKILSIPIFPELAEDGKNKIISLINNFKD